MLVLLASDFLARSEAFLRVALSREVLARHLDVDCSYASVGLPAHTVDILNAFHVLLHNALRHLMMIRLRLIS